MQKLSLIQLQAISGGNSDPEGNIVTKTLDAFKNGLSQSELGVGHVGFVMGATLVALPYNNIYKAVALIAAELGYIGYTQGHYASVTNYFKGKSA